MPHVVADELFHEIAHGATRESPLWAAALLPEPERRAEAVFSALVPDPRFALGVETIYEGYLLHYGRARIFAPPDGDVTLLLGDALLAHGLVRIAETGLDRGRRRPRRAALALRAGAGGRARR